MSQSLALLNIADGIATLRLNDPDRLNAVSTEMLLEMRAGLEKAEKEARVVVICGVGRSFCSGANLADGMVDRIKEPGFDAGARLEFTINPLMRQIRELQLPVITAVRGAAAGVGCSLALIADLIVAGESAYFLQAFRRIGLIPDGGSTFLLSRAIGRVRAMEMMMLAEKLPAAKALEWGLINRVVPDDQVESSAMELARELASGPTVAISLMRKAAWAGAEENFNLALDTERMLQKQAGQTSDFYEGVTAFLGKRKAQFKGR